VSSPITVLRREFKSSFAALFSVMLAVPRKLACLGSATHGLVDDLLTLRNFVDNLIDDRRCSVFSQLSRELVE